MTINRSLLAWQCRLMLPVTLVAVPLATGYAALESSLLWWHSDFLALLFVTIHGWWLVLSVGRPDRKSTRLNSSHVSESRMPSSA